MNGGFVCRYVSSVRLAVYFYLILQTWPPFANSAIFAADSFRWHGNRLKRRRLAGRSFIQRPQERHWETQPATWPLQYRFSEVFVRELLLKVDKTRLTIRDYVKTEGALL